MQDDEALQDKNVKVFRMHLFKFWQNNDSRTAWRNYIFSDCIENNINSLYIAVKIFEKVLGYFI